MLSRFLVIGVGGSGGRTVRHLQADLLARIRGQLPDYEGFPACWQLLHVDVPSADDWKVVDPPPLPSSHYVGLVSDNVDYPSVYQNLTRRGADVVAASGNWIPSPLDAQSINIEGGAGQYRSLGRVITVNRLDLIGRAIESALGRMRTKEADADLSRLSTAFGASESGEPRPVAIVVSSLGGGAGSGSFLDVCDVLRAQSTDVWADNSVGLLFTPDIFSGAPTYERRGVAANTLAAVAEVTAGYWRDEAYSDGDRAFLKAGEMAWRTNRRGPRYPFLIGRSNGAVTYPDPASAYRATGSAVAAWITSPAIQGGIASAVLGNWEKGKAPDNLQLFDGKTAPFSSLGFSRFGLGRDRFETYASERLGRTVVDRFLRGHLEDDPDASAAQREQLLEESVAKAGGVVEFLRSCGLHEHGEGEGNDQILDGLRSKTRTSEIFTPERAAFEKAVKAKRIGRVADWIELISARVREISSDVIQRSESSDIQQARSWARDIQDVVAEHTADTVSRFGAPTAVSLLRQSIADLEAAVTELRSEAMIHERNYSEQDRYITGALPVASGKKDEVRSDHPALAKAVKAATDALWMKSEANLRSLAIELIEDLATNLLAPIMEALAWSVQGLAEEEVTRIGGSLSVIEEWPTPVGDVIPSRLVPPLNEHLLDPVETYPGAYLRLLSEDVGTKDLLSAPRMAAREVLLAKSPDNRQSLVLFDRRWWPKSSKLADAGGVEVPSRAIVRIDASAATILSGSRKWLRRTDTATSRHLNQTLVDYLTPSQAGRTPTAKLSSFRESMGAAIRSAIPMADIDTRALQAVHGEARGEVNFLLRQLPNGLPKDAQTVGQQVLTDIAKVEPDDLAKWFGGAATAEVEVFGYFTAPRLPMVYTSLLGPIADDWGGRSEAGRAEFWRWRRSRPLDRFVPVPPATLTAMIRGWFTARLLGQVELNIDGPIKVWVPKGDLSSSPTWASVPYPLLGTRLTKLSIGTEGLPAVLESLVLAYLEIASGSVDVLMPYRRLFLLGRSASGQNDYDELSEELYAWLLTGTLPAGAPAADPERLGSAVEADWEERRAKALAVLESAATSYRSRLASEDRAPESAYRLSRLWSLRTEVELSLQQLIDGVRSFESEATWKDPFDT